MWCSIDGRFNGSSSNILLGEKIPLDVVNGESGDILIPANRKITKTLLRKLAANYEHVEIDPSPIRIKIMGIIDEYRNKFVEARQDKDRSLDRAGSGEELDAGIVKSVKVYIATKKKLSVGDKMAGRGNRGSRDCCGRGYAFLTRWNACRCGIESVGRAFTYECGAGIGAPPRLGV